MTKEEQIRALREQVGESVPREVDVSGAKVGGRTEVNLVQLCERVRRKTSELEVVELCDEFLLLIQYRSMHGRGVENPEQYIEPWVKQGISRATYFRKKAEEQKG